MLTTALTAAVLAWYILAGRCVVRLRRARLRWPLFADILRVGGVGSISTLQTTLTVALTTALVGAAGGPDAVAGYGTGARLEYLLIPLVFGLGAPLVALVGTNIGAGQQRARAAHRPHRRRPRLRPDRDDRPRRRDLAEAWLGLFGNDPHMLETGAAYLRVVGPTYGFFGLGLSLYFASQGAGRLVWPLLGGMVRLLLAVGGGWLALTLTGSLAWVFAALALGAGRLRRDRGRRRSPRASGSAAGDRAGRGAPKRPRGGPDGSRRSAGHRPTAPRPRRARQPGQGQEAVHHARAARRLEVALDAAAEERGDAGSGRGTAPARRRPGRSAARRSSGAVPTTGPRRRAAWAWRRRPSRRG